MSSISSVSGSGPSLFDLIRKGSGKKSRAARNAISTANTLLGGQQSGQNSLFSQIQAAVTSALQTAKASGSSNPNPTIESAIAQVLKNNNNATGGANSNSLISALQALTSQPDSDSNTASNISSSAQAFFKLLHQNGVSKQQFRADFAAAVNDVQSGNGTSAATNLPPGSLLDLLA